MKKIRVETEFPIDNLFGARGKPDSSVLPPKIHEEHKERTDEEILTLSFTNPDLFEIIVVRYEEAFLRKALSMVRDEEVSADIVQDTFVKIYSHGRKFVPQEGAQFSSWAYKILINTCLTWFKKVKREKEFSAMVDEEYMVNIADNSRSAEFRLDTDYLLSLTERLPVSLSKVIKLYVTEGKDYEAIAKTLDIEEGAVRTRMHRAKNELRKLASEIRY